MGKKQSLKKAESGKVAKVAKPARKSAVKATKEPVAKTTRTRKKKPTELDNPPQAEPSLVRVAGPPMRRKEMPNVVPGGKSTLEPGNRKRYSDPELEEFKLLIEKKLDDARNDYEILKRTLANTDSNGTENTDSASLKLIEDGSETLSREETSRLAGRQEKFIKNLENALLRIRNKTYGICSVTTKLISKERLRATLVATTCVEVKAHQPGQKGAVTGVPVRVRLDAIAA